MVDVTKDTATDAALAAREKKKEAKRVQDGLTRPFAAKAVKFKPQTVKNNRCLAMAYIDARLVQDRLDEVVGVNGWQDQYETIADGSVVCRLSVWVHDEWITKADVGSPSEQPDSGDRMKAAFSDALKRAAVKFGIGRYLYRLAAHWVDYDPVKKQIVTPPQLPAFAIPANAPEHEEVPDAPPEPEPNPRQKAPEPVPPNLRQQRLDTVRTAAGRPHLEALYRLVQQDQKDGRLSEADAGEVFAAITHAAKRFPKPPEPQQKPTQPAGKGV